MQNRMYLVMFMFVLGLSSCALIPHGNISVVGLGPNVMDTPVRSGNTYYRAGLTIPNATFANNHAAGIVELPDGRVLITWFAGEYETSTDTAILASVYDQSGVHSPPRVVVRASDKGPGGSYIRTLGNSSLYQHPDGTLWIFYNTTIGGWALTTVHSRFSRDGGMTWSGPQEVIGTPGNLIRAKPIELLDHTLILPAYGELFTREGYVCTLTFPRAHAETSCGAYVGVTGMIQPTVVPSGNSLIAFFRNREFGNIMRAVSSDNGKTWRDIGMTDLPNNDSGIAALRLPNGKIAMFYNNTHSGRTPLSVAISSDDGVSFVHMRDLETTPGEYSYPEAIVTHDGLIHIIYTYNRKTIKHVIVNEAWLTTRVP